MAVTLTRPIVSPTVSTCYIARIDDEVVMFDSGEAGNAQVIVDGLHSLGISVRSVRAILVTHPHPDHVGSLAELVRLTGAPVYASVHDKPLIEAGQPGPLATVKDAWLSRFLFKRIVLGGAHNCEPCTVTHALESGDRVPFCGGLETIALPGHSAGHIGFAAPAFRAIFAGDALLNIGPFAPRLSHWHDDPVAEIESLKLLAVRDWDTLYIGHGPPVTRRAFERMMRKLVR